MTRVFLLDDHEIVRRGLAELLGSEPDLEIVGQTGTAASGLREILALQPDVAVLDVRLPDGNGIELCRELRSRLPELNVLILTSYTDEEAMLNAILAGAGGYAIKDIAGLHLVSAVREVGSGRSLLDTRAASTLMAKLRANAADHGPLAGLTDRERTLLDLIGEGLTNAQIAQRMFLAEKTIKNYVSSVLSKLGLERRTQAAVLQTELRPPASG